MPLARGAAVLADSEDRPLYYLQETEGLRPNLDRMVLPHDGAAYRAELDARQPHADGESACTLLDRVLESVTVRCARPGPRWRLARSRWRNFLR